MEEIKPCGDRHPHLVWSIQQLRAAQRRKVRGEMLALRVCARVCVRQREKHLRNVVVNAVGCIGEQVKDLQSLKPVLSC